MPDHATTTPDDVRRYVETDLSESEIAAYLDDAEAEALAYNELEDFYDGELDRLVKFYTALLIGKQADSGGSAKRFARGARSVTLKTPAENDRSWLGRRVHANDPNGKVMSGRYGLHHYSVTGGGE